MTAANRIKVDPDHLVDDAEARRSISAERVAFEANWPFFYWLLMWLHPVEVPDLQSGTLATDGKHLFYQPEYVKKLYKAKQLHIGLAHEVLHCAFRHMYMQQMCDPWTNKDLMNIATDIVVNSTLRRQGFTLPDGWIDVPMYDGLDTITIYNSLVRSAKKQDDGSYEITLQTGQQQQQPDSIGSKGKKKGKQDGKQLVIKIIPQCVVDPGDVDGSADSKDNADGEGDKHDHSWTENDAERAAEAWKDRLKQAAEYASSKSQGSVPAGFERIIEEMLAPRLDWAVALNEFCARHGAYDYTMKRPNRRFIGGGVYLPSIVEEEFDLLIILDTSGSMGDRTLARFRGELAECMDTYHARVGLICADAAVGRTVTGEDIRFLQSGDEIPTEFPGGGGTDFRPAVELAEKLGKPFIYYTDGYGSWPEKTISVPNLWVITTGAHVPDGIKYVRYDAEEQDS